MTQLRCNLLENISIQKEELIDILYTIKLSLLLNMKIKEHCETGPAKG